MDIHEFCVYGDDFGGEELADDIEGFGLIDDRDLHGADRAFADLPEPVEEPAR